jgi:hypothetical protein
VLFGSGVVSGTGTVYADIVNAATIGNASASLVGGTVSATGNVTGGNLNTAGTATIGGFTISGNTIVSAGSTLTIDPAGSGGTDGTVVIAGNLTVQGNTTTINSNVVTTNDLTINLANNATSSSQANGGGIEVGPLGSPYITWLYNNIANTWTTGGGISATGNVTGGNISATTYTGTTVSVTGNVTGGNVLFGSGVVSGTGTITAATVNAATIGNAGAAFTGASVSAATIGNASASLVGGTVSATGNVTGGNINTGGLISATGNIIAGPSSYFIGNGSQLTGVTATSAGFPITSGTSNINAVLNGNISVTVAATPNVVVFASTGEYVTGLISANGNVIGGNLTTGGQVSATANITGGNVLTGGLISAAANITAGGSQVNFGNTANVSGPGGHITYNSTLISFDFTFS